MNQYFLGHDSECCNFLGQVGRNKWIYAIFCCKKHPNKIVLNDKFETFSPWILTPQDVESGYGKEFKDKVMSLFPTETPQQCFFKDHDAKCCVYKGQCKNEKFPYHVFVHESKNVLVGGSVHKLESKNSLVSPGPFQDFWIEAFNLVEKEDKPIVYFNNHSKDCCTFLDGFDGHKFFKCTQYPNKFVYHVDDMSNPLIKTSKDFIATGYGPQFRERVFKLYGAILAPANPDCIIESVPPQPIDVNVFCKRMFARKIKGF